ncbi:CTB family bacteriocin [Nodularia chucula]|uniref:CTB family bacteriocin n=1 Tax=Nodularia chucula TaxID=3093667 RepID=UPI0039C60023
MSDQLFTEVSDEQQEAVSGGFLSQFQNFGATLNGSIFNAASGIAAGDTTSGPGGSTASGVAGFEALFSAGLNISIFGSANGPIVLPPIGPTDPVIPIIPTPPGPGPGPIVP